MPGPFVIFRDSRGALVHVRNRQSGECLGCVEVGLYEIVRELILAEERQLPLKTVEVERECRPS